MTHGSSKSSIPWRTWSFTALHSQDRSPTKKTGSLSSWNTPKNVPAKPTWMSIWQQQTPLLTRYRLESQLGKTPIRNIMTHRYCFNAFVTTLQESLQLNEELKSPAHSANIFSETFADQDNATFLQRYIRYMVYVRKYDLPRKLSQAQFPLENRPSMCPRKYSRKPSLSSSPRRIHTHIVTDLSWLLSAKIKIPRKTWVSLWREQVVTQMYNSLTKRLASLQLSFPWTHTKKFMSWISTTLLTPIYCLQFSTKPHIMSTFDLVFNNAVVGNSLPSSPNPSYALKCRAAYTPLGRDWLFPYKHFRTPSRAA